MKDEILGGTILVALLIGGAGYYYVKNERKECGDYVTIQADLLRDIISKGWLEKLKEGVIEEVPTPFKKGKK